MGTTADFSGFTAGLSTMPSESCSTMPHSIADPPGGRVDRSGRDEQDLAGLERYRWLGVGAPSGVDGNGPKRFSVQRKMAIVARLLRGEPLDLVARQTNVSVAKLTAWRDRALAGAATALKERERDDRDDEIARLKSKVGEITMDNELLNAKIAALEGKRPLAPRRSRR